MVFKKCCIATRTTKKPQNLRDFGDFFPVCLVKDFAYNYEESIHTLLNRADYEKVQAAHGHWRTLSGTAWNFWMDTTHSSLRHKE